MAGRRVNLIPEGIQQAFVEFKFGKVVTVMFYLLWALIIDVTPQIFICLYGMVLSGIVFRTRAVAVFARLFYMSQFGSAFVVTDLLRLNIFHPMTVCDESGTSTVFLLVGAWGAGRGCKANSGYRYWKRSVGVNAGAQ